MCQFILARPLICSITSADCGLKAKCRPCCRKLFENGPKSDAFFVILLAKPFAVSDPAENQDSNVQVSDSLDVSFSESYYSLEHDWDNPQSDGSD